MLSHCIASFVDLDFNQSVIQMQIDTRAMNLLSLSSKAWDFLSERLKVTTIFSSACHKLNI